MEDIELVSEIKLVIFSLKDLKIEKNDLRFLHLEVDGSSYTLYEDNFEIFQIY